MRGEAQLGEKGERRRYRTYSYITAQQPLLDSGLAGLDQRWGGKDVGVRWTYGQELKAPLWAGAYWAAQWVDLEELLDDISMWVSCTRSTVTYVRAECPGLELDSSGIYQHVIAQQEHGFLTCWFTLLAKAAALACWPATEWSAKQLWGQKVHDSNSMHA